MKLRYTLFLCGALCISTNHAAAQDIERMPFFNRSNAIAAIERALSLLPRVKCGKEQCAPATTEEFASPPVDPGDAREALLVGAKSARLKWCGLKWQERAFPAMMQEFQQRGIHNTRKLAILGLIHNEQFNKDYANLQALKTCDDGLRETLDKQNPSIEIPSWQHVVNKAFLDQSVADMLQRVLSEIQKSRCGPILCTPATDEEKANPPVTVEQARRAMKIGLLSGAAEFCGIDWKKRIFFPFMAAHRNGLKMSTRQLAIVSMLHGTMQGFVLESYQKHEQSCPEKLKANLEKQLSKG